MDAKLAILLSLFACVLNSIGQAIPYWLVASISEAGLSASVNMGLWSVCVHWDIPGANIDKCLAQWDNRDHSVPRYIIEAGYIEIGASILMFSSTIYGVVRTVIHTPTVVYTTRESGVICILAGIMALAGCIVFASETIAGYYYHVGFALCIVAGLISIISGILYLLARKDTQDMQDIQFTRFA
ncbi:uncharacterized protein LOC127853818 [Dreissena polymorpha]|uniref:Claudin n=1 Tax=Dreissena polymorpha TaxID=45954 RepID=A0A9D4CLU1_DREPO|nr:uncharacterized protein LOC127853818 [Dreissena polymorpha]KAH3727352.1 hypothetical protein DPMN_053286 [Dreissena polymorpha]